MQLEIEIVRWKVSQIPAVPPQTAGVNPVNIDHSSEKGSMVLFDFAGHQEFYSSHAALLEHLESSDGAVLIILLDLCKAKLELKVSLESWMSFLGSIYSNSLPPLIVVGSHSDVLKKKGKRPFEKLHSICEAAGVLKRDSKPLLLAMNCTKQSSNKLTRLSETLHEHLDEYHMKFQVSTQVHVLNALIKEKFKSSEACKIHEIVELLGRQNEGLFQYNLLPSLSEEETLSQLICQLSELGEFVYLKDNCNFTEGWIVFDKHLLFTEVNGTIFSPENFSTHYSISNSTGIVYKQSLQEVFRHHNIEMIIKFLTYFKYCYEIPGNVRPYSAEVYFFPQLVKQCKAKMCYFQGCSYSCKWQLKCTKAYQHFSSRFTQSIIVHLATSYSLTPEGIDNDSCPVIVKECNVWNLGIHWKDMDGVEIIVEFDETYKTMFLEIGCHKGAELPLVKLRSELIKIILQIKSHSLKDTETSESFIYPPNLNSESWDDSFEYSTDRLYLASTTDKKYVTSKKDCIIEQISLDDLLYMEPFSLISHDIIIQLFGMANADALLNSHQLSHLDTISKSDNTGFIVSLLKCDRELTYSVLREHISSYSIFSNPKVRNNDYSCG